MINVYDGSSYALLTLQEKCLLSAPNYLFRFVNNTTKAEVSMVKKYTEDLSGFKVRYNKFLIKDLPEGQYTYFVYEQASASNTDPEKARLIESGLAMVHPPAGSYTYHAKSNNYVTR